jgi:hypothetical protein
MFHTLNKEYIDLANVSPLDKLTAMDWTNLTGGWVNDIPVEELSDFTGIHPAIIRAFYSFRDLAYFQENGYWPDDLKVEED